MFLGEVLISWILLLFSLPLCAWVIWTIRETNYEIEATTHVEDISDGKIGNIAIPGDHHAAHDNPIKGQLALEQIANNVA